MAADQNIQERPALSPGKIVLRLLVYGIFLGAILFGSAGRLDWTLGWVWLGLHVLVLWSSPCSSCPSIPVWSRNAPRSKKG